MGTRGYVGRADANDPDTLRLRYVHCDAVPDYVVATLLTIRQATFDGDTTATVDALLAHTWVYLGADVTSADMTGDRPVPGVGMAIDSPPIPPMTVPLDRVGDLDGVWVYLLDPGGETLTVLRTADGGDPVSPIRPHLTRRRDRTAPPSRPARPSRPHSGRTATRGTAPHLPWHSTRTPARDPRAGATL